VLFSGLPGQRRRKYNLWESIFFVLLVLFTGYVLLQSSLFEVREIVVRGNQSLSAEKVIAVSGIHTGANIFKIDLGEAAKKLELLPVLREVRLSRVMPGAVVIEVEEREPVALVPTGGGFVEVDEEVVHLRPGRVGATGLPVLTGVSAKSLGPGRGMTGEGLDELIRVVLELPPELKGRLSEVHLDEGGSVILYTLEGIPCKMGVPKDIRAKGLLLLEVLHELQDRGKRIEYVDLSFIGTPVVKYVE
jgi:cell division protein FtsQ